MPVSGWKWTHPGVCIYIKSKDVIQADDRDKGAKTDGE